MILEDLQARFCNTTVLKSNSLLFSSCQEGNVSSNGVVLACSRKRNSQCGEQQQTDETSWNPHDSPQSRLWQLIPGPAVSASAFAWRHSILYCPHFPRISSPQIFLRRSYSGVVTRLHAISTVSRRRADQSVQRSPAVSPNLQTTVRPAGSAFHSRQRFAKRGDSCEAG